MKLCTAAEPKSEFHQVKFTTTYACKSRVTGQKIWRCPYPSRVRRNAATWASVAASVRSAGPVVSSVSAPPAAR